MMKRFIKAFALSIALSVLFVTPALAALKIADANSYTWTEVDGILNCVDEDGDPVRGWVEYNDNTYYLDKEGNIKTGWIKAKGSWYYLDEESGVLLKEQWIDNYYVNDTGKMTKIR